MRKQLLPALPSLLLLATPALAAAPSADQNQANRTHSSQNQASAQNSAGSDQDSSHPNAAAPPQADRLTAAEAHGLIDMKARSASGDDLGEVENVLVDRNGKVRAVVVQSGGGSLFSDNRKVAVDWKAVQLSPEQNQLTIQLTKQELEAAGPYRSGKPSAIAGASDAGKAAAQQNASGQGNAKDGKISEDQVRSALRDRGYSDISGLDRDGDAFKVNEAKRYGEKVHDLRVDAKTGQVKDAQKLDKEQARNLLQDQGYSKISDLSRDGDTITGKATRNGHEERVRIDANSGQVARQQASD